MAGEPVRKGKQVTASIDHTPYRNLFARHGMLALVSVLLLAGVAVPAGAQGAGQYTLQCSCPLWWNDPWDGNGVFNAAASLDTVALANDPAVLLIHETPLSAGTIAGMVEDRTASLESSRAIDDLDEFVIDEDDDFTVIGRIWDNRHGETIFSVQHVQVWESNFLLSVEYVAPEDAFVEMWDSLQDVLLIGQPVLGAFDPEDLLDELAPQSRPDPRSRIAIV